MPTQTIEPGIMSVEQKGDLSSDLGRTAIRLLLNELHRQDDPGYNAGSGEVNQYLAFIDSSRDTHHILRDEMGNVIAAAHVKYGQVGKTTELSGLAVDPSHRGSGYGTQLVRHIASQSKTRGDTTIGLFAKNPEFFAGAGFHRDVPGENYMIATPDAVERHLGAKQLATQRR